MKHVARKRFGQHFLIDPALIDRIAAAVDPKPGQAVLEIGPGLGALTEALLSRCAALTVVEIDRDLAARLRRRSGLQVIEADILEVGLDELLAAMPEPPPLRIVGNLPYNISTPILFHLLGWAEQVADQHFMLQREVVERMVAEPDGRTYGRLSVMLQWRYEMEWVLEVPPVAFDPPPAVDSAVVRMRPRPDPDPCEPRLLEEVVRVAFSQRRKLLRHTLGRWLDARAAAGVGSVGAFDTQRRAEEVPVQEYVRLAAALGASLRPPP